ncbi:hypothetical protein [Xanthomonas arboricola]|uniref:hypothetical protein n=1 Tax=Xanthomonas arboricola TaxID=56448 RepID=UPI003EBD95C8
MSTEIKCSFPSGDGSLRWLCTARRPELTTNALAGIAVRPVLASDLVFGHPRELFRVTHAGDVVVSEGVSTNDAARAFWEAVEQMRPGSASRLNEPFGNSEQLAQPDAAGGLNEQSGNSGQLQADAASGGDAPIDVTDPWRGLYQPERLRAYNEYGEVCHPDTPSWPDDREDALDKLVHAQGFDFQIVAGDFSDEATEDGDELYWQEMRAWNPEAPEGDWRLAWKGDTEDGPYAWFVRPMALRPAPEALTAGEPVGKEPAMYADTEFRQAQSAEYMAMGKGSKEGLWPRINAKYIVPLYTAPPAPAAVPAEITAQEMEWLHYAIAHMLDDSEPEDQACAKALQALVARLVARHCFVTHPKSEAQEPRA